MRICLWRIHLVCVCIPPICHGPLDFDDGFYQEEEGGCLQSFLEVGEGVN